MTSPTAQLHTAAQLAAPLDKAPRSIRRALEGVPPSSVSLVNGVEAKVWSLSALPKALREEIESKAREKHFCDGSAMLAAPAALDAAKNVKLAALRDRWGSAANEPRGKAVKLQGRRI